MTFQGLIIPIPKPQKPIPAPVVGIVRPFRYTILLKQSVKSRLHAVSMRHKVAMTQIIGNAIEKEVSRLERTESIF